MPSRPQTAQNRGSPQFCGDGWHSPPSPEMSPHRPSKKEMEQSNNIGMVHKLPPCDKKPPRPTTALPRVKFELPRRNHGSLRPQTSPASGRREVAGPRPNPGTVRQEYKRPGTAGTHKPAGRSSILVSAASPSRYLDPRKPWWVQRPPNPQNGAHRGGVLAGYADNRRCMAAF